MFNRQNSLGLLKKSSNQRKNAAAAAAPPSASSSSILAPSSNPSSHHQSTKRSRQDENDYSAYQEFSEVYDVDYGEYVHGSENHPSSLPTTTSSGNTMREREGAETNPTDSLFFVEDVVEEEEDLEDDNLVPMSFCDLEVGNASEVDSDEYELELEEEMEDFQNKSYGDMEEGRVNSDFLDLKNDAQSFMSRVDNPLNFVPALWYLSAKEKSQFGKDQRFPHEDFRSLLASNPEYRKRLIAGINEIRDFCLVREKILNHHGLALIHPNCSSTVKDLSMDVVEWQNKIGVPDSAIKELIVKLTQRFKGANINMPVKSYLSRKDARSCNTPVLKEKCVVHDYVHVFKDSSFRIDICHSYCKTFFAEPTALRCSKCQEWRYSPCSHPKCKQLRYFQYSPQVYISIFNLVLDNSIYAFSIICRICRNMTWRDLFWAMMMTKMTMEVLLKVVVEFRMRRLSMIMKIIMERKTIMKSMLQQMMILSEQNFIQIITLMMFRVTMIEPQCRRYSIIRFCSCWEFWLELLPFSCP